MKYQRSTTLGCKNIEVIISEFVAKNQFLYFYLSWSEFYIYGSKEQQSVINPKLKKSVLKCIFYNALHSWLLESIFYLDYPETAVLSCSFTIKYMFSCV